MPFYESAQALHTKRHSGALRSSPGHRRVRIAISGASAGLQVIRLSHAA